jgi:hypothetical protein
LGSGKIRRSGKLSHTYHQPQPNTDNRFAYSQPSQNGFLRTRLCRYQVWRRTHDRIARSYLGQDRCILTQLDQTKQTAEQLNGLFADDYAGAIKHSSWIDLDCRRDLVNPPNHTTNNQPKLATRSSLPPREQLESEDGLVVFAKKRRRDGLVLVLSSLCLRRLWFSTHLSVNSTSSSNYYGSSTARPLATDPKAGRKYEGSLLYVHSDPQGRNRSGRGQRPLRPGKPAFQTSPTI